MTKDVFDDVRDRALGELTPEQQNRAYELWLRENLGAMTEYHREHYARLLAVIDLLRSNQPPEWFDAPFAAPDLASMGLTAPTPREFGEALAQRYKHKIQKLEAEAKSYGHTEESAAAAIRDFVSPPDCLYGGYVDMNLLTYEPEFSASGTITLNGEFDGKTLRAVLWFMENRKPEG
jgi:hypothetical protein